MNASLRTLLAAVSLVGFVPMRGQAPVAEPGRAGPDADIDWRERRAGMLRERKADLAALRAEIEGLLRERTGDF